MTPAGGGSPYLLQRLARCAGHDLVLQCPPVEVMCAPVDPAGRVYRCPSTDHRGRGVWPAGGLESRVVTAAQQHAALGYVSADLATALRRVIAVVLVGPGPDDVEIRWRT
nr:hypothetical protein [Micromonospora sp. DSM 115978]